MVQRKRQVHFMACRAEFGGLVKWLEKGLFMESGFCFDKLIVDGLQHWIIAEGERVMDWFFDREISVPSRRVDIRDGMACSAGDSRLSRRVPHHIEIRIVKSTTEKWHRIVASSAPA